MADEEHGNIVVSLFALAKLFEECCSFAADGGSGIQFAHAIPPVRCDILNGST